MAEIHRVGIIGAGAMGAGIAQVCAQAGLSVMLYDAVGGAAQACIERLAGVFDTLVDKRKMSPQQRQQALANLQVGQALAQLGDCQLIIEAIVEKLDAKQRLFTELEQIVAPECILASNTSSLSITAIAAPCQHPSRVAGLHFFNPVALMKVVEVIDGLHTDPAVGERLMALVSRLGHQPVRSRDTPGFIINHAGRAYGTEALALLGERVAPVAVIDCILRESMGFRMGPFELFDLTALDVSHPVMESIYQQYYHDPRYRPSVITRQRLEAGQLGRKSGEGFYRYPRPEASAEAPVTLAEPGDRPAVWVGADDPADLALLVAWLQALGLQLDRAATPAAGSLCLLAPYGRDATGAALAFGTDPRRTLCIDMLPGLDRHRTLMCTPVTDARLLTFALAAFAQDGVGVSLIEDSLGFVCQRVMAAIVNLACEIAQQGVASPAHIDQAVRLGLGYPQGPLSWGDQLGAKRVLMILQRMVDTAHDPRYRPSPWLRRRALLDVSLSHERAAGL
ncbi:3-hydroxyadipyl-CoA dehydrogenase [Pseudomonas reidholzensis]|uniref:3-hydroxyadipyl-CoA dehydrogenase n=1 Tax=Pseudomonas reidholzensis TaxID=1785162 RepID=A0A383RWS9_9PSED|nr:3-hydroxyacyl-CoA dehydrogenase [Pseudomonas reidholzensis]SYX90848.1 3-hydroxyadipyl-CoA dehydrogenase [Pseudomonas reidholzensis]